MNKDQIGGYVKQQREAQSLTQVQLADKAEVRRATIIEIENNKHDYSISKLLSVLAALNIKLIFESKITTFNFKGVPSKIKI